MVIGSFAEGRCGFGAAPARDSIMLFSVVFIFKLLVVVFVSRKSYISAIDVWYIGKGR
jgi:hypothetical protein